MATKNVSKEQSFGSSKEIVFDDFFEKWMEKEQERNDFIKKHKEDILLKIIKYMKDTKKYMIDSENILYDESRKLDEKEFCILAEHLLLIAKQQDKSVSSHGYFPDEYACFSYNNRRFVVRRVIGQGTLLQMMFTDINEFWKDHLVIDFKSIDFLKGIKFHIDVTGTSFSGDLQKFTITKSLEIFNESKYIMKLDQENPVNTFPFREDLTRFLFQLLSNIYENNFLNENSLEALTVSFYKETESNSKQSVVKKISEHYFFN